MIATLHAEWTKLRTLPGTWWLLAAAAAAFSCPPGRCTLAATGTDPARLSLTGLYLGQVLIAVGGVAVIGGEYGTGLIRLTLAATPRRLTVLGAKATLVTGWSLAAGLAGVAGALLVGRLILPGTLPLGGPADVRAALGSVLYLVLIALLALGLTTAVRESALGIASVLGLLFVFPLVAAVIPDQILARHLQQLAPMTAGLDVQATIGLAALPLTPWQGLGVTALWTAGALLLGAAVLSRRDA